MPNAQASKLKHHALVASEKLLCHFTLHITAQVFDFCFMSSFDNDFHVAMAGSISSFARVPSGEWALSFADIILFNMNSESFSSGSGYISGSSSWKDFSNPSSSLRFKNPVLSLSY